MIKIKKQKPHIVVSEKLKQELGKLVQNKQDTYEDIIWRLLKKREKLNDIIKIN